MFNKNLADDLIRTFGIGSNRSTTWATTIALGNVYIDAVIWIHNLHMAVTIFVK